MPVLTHAAIIKYVPLRRRREIRDHQAPGLYLVIQVSGSKSWAMRFRRPDGKPAKLTLGPVNLTGVETNGDPVLGASLTLRQARQLAIKFDRDRAMGIDVVAEERSKKQRAEVAEASTFGAAARDYFIYHRTRWGRPRHWRREARLLGLNWPVGCDPALTAPAVIPDGLAATWATKAVAAIDRPAIIAIIEAAHRHAIPGLGRRNMGISDARGRKMHGVLSGLFGWLQQKGRVTTNPCTGVWKPDPAPARERVLTEAEVVAVWHAADAVGVPFGALIKILLLTGCRLNEAAGMRRDELVAGLWTQPGSRTKNHREHKVPLPSLAQTIMEGMPRIAGSDFVFTATGEPLSGWSKMKKRLDGHMQASAPWRLHDLRRTAATGMAELGIAPHIIEACLNHVSGAKAGVAGIYNRAKYEPEKAAALARWAAHVEGLVSGAPAKVVPLTRGRS